MGKQTNTIMESVDNINNMVHGGKWGGGCLQKSSGEKEEGRGRKVIYSEKKKKINIKLVQTETQLYFHL